MPTPGELEFWGQFGGQEKAEFFFGEGCNFCARTGYQDRVGVYEVLPMTAEIRDLVARKASWDEIRDAAVSGGMRPLREEGVRLVAEDVTTIAEIVRSIYVL